MWPGTAAALLGAGFAGYLLYGRMAAPRSSCGCTARDGAVGPRAFLRAGLVAAGGAAAALSTAPWWEAAGRRPGASLDLLAAFLAVTAALFAGPGRLLTPVRRPRLLGHPLGAGGTAVPVEASVELLERSLAWEAASPVVRSGLRDHGNEDGWRFLLYTGAYGENGGTRQVPVVFALDARADLDAAGGPACGSPSWTREAPSPYPRRSRASRRGPPDRPATDRGPMRRLRARRTGTGSRGRPVQKRWQL